MSMPVLWHNVVQAQPVATEGSSSWFAPASGPRASARQSYGRGLYGRKLSSRPPRDGTATKVPQASALVGRPPRTLLRWQLPLAYLVIWQSSGYLVTWHAPWCRRCDCAGAGWHFALDDGYLAGLGFELSSPRYADQASDTSA
jgi:hypothetical protein